jgi:hypothetical protein
MSALPGKTVYGVMAEFENPEALLEATKAAYRAGYRTMDAYTPYPIEELSESIGFKREGVALIALLGGLGGGLLAFGMETYCNVFDYPINVGGRPDFSWPAFIPVTFELTVLGAALSAAFGMLALNRLPKLWHPVFDLPEFARASRDRFFLCIQSKDAIFDPVAIRALLGKFAPLTLREVPFEG